MVLLSEPVELPSTQVVKNPPAMQEIWAQPCWEDGVKQKLQIAQS